MKLVREYINEKFTEDGSDPITDMGIGLLHKLRQEYAKQYSWFKSDPNTITLKQLMIFCLSRKEYDLSVIDALISAGVDVKEKDNHYLSHAVSRGIDFVKFFLEKGANAKDNKSNALSIAINYKFFDIAELLLKHGANIYGSAALAGAVKRNDKTTVQWLLDRGANPNSYGYRCLKYALKTKNYELADLFAKEYLKSRNK